MGKKKSKPAQQTSSTTVSESPWGPQQQHLTNIFSEAYQNYANRGAPQQFFPGQTYAPFHPLEQEAFNLAEHRAKTGSPATKAVRDYSMGILSGSPEALQSTLGPRVGELLPALQSQFNRAGMGASSLARGAEQELVMRELSKLKESAANRLMQLGPQEYNDILALEALGGTKRDMDQQAINEAMARYQFNQDEPWNRLAKYLQSVMGSYGGQKTTSEFGAPTGGGSRLSGLLSGATSGAGLGAKITGANPWGAAIGGLLGGGIGAFF